MIAGAGETFAVVLIVAAAAGYLSLWLRKSARRGGCCCRGRSPGLPPAGGADPGKTPGCDPSTCSGNLNDGSPAQRSQTAASEDGKPE